MNVDEMQYLAKLLNVDELHVIDENGFIVAASVSRYVGFDMSKHEQTRPFLAMLENDKEEDYLIQEAQPNASDNKMMQYIGVTRKEKKGIIQVGFKPTRQLEAKARNTYEYIFSRFPTDSGEQLFAVDRFTGDILGHSDGMNTDFSAAYYQPEQLLECTNGSYKKEENGNSMYVVVREYGDILIGLAIPQKNLTQQLFKQVFNTLWYLLLIEAIVLILLNYLVKRKVVNGIHLIIQNLTGIHMSESNVCAVVMLDLDFFKSINDTFGHDIGDKYLQSFSNMMHSMPSEHFLCARRSGDEFCMMLFNYNDKNDIIQYLNQFYQTLEQIPVQLSDSQSKIISASSGFAWTSDSNANIDELLNYADEALYDIKRETKGRFGEYHMS